MSHSTTSPPSRVLIVGGGSIGERHVRCFLKTGECRVSVCETDVAKRERLARAYALERTFADFGQVPLDQFRVVVVATPAPFHIPQSLAAVRAGCHVLCEKPLSDKPDGIAELLAAVREKNRVAAVAFTLRSVSALRRLKQVIDDGVIGTPRFAFINFTQFFPHLRPDYRTIYFARKSLGGGCLFDMCPHALNLLEWLLGPEATVSCLTDRLALEGIETDDTTLLQIRHRSGACSQVTATLMAYHYRYDVSVHGTRGSVVYDYVKGEVSVHSEPEPPARGRFEKFHSERDELYIEQARRFLAATRGEEPVACTIEEGWQTLRAVWAAQRSVETGRTEPVA